MERTAAFIRFIFVVLSGLLCAEALNPDPRLSHNAVFRNPMAGPVQISQQSSVGFAPNMFQNLIAPAAAWKPAPALVVPSLQVQSQRLNYAQMPIQPIPALQSQALLNPQQEGFQWPIPGPNLHPDLKDEVVMGPVFDPIAPSPANTVEAQCEEASIKVHVQQNFLGNGQLIVPSDLTLGGCPFTGFDDQAKVIAFESELQACGSSLTMTPDSLVYSFALVYSPSPVPNTPIDKTNEALVAIHCIYPRLHNVSSSALHPAWAQYAEMKASEEQLHFSLKLMTDDWNYERPSETYFLGDFINLEASVVRANHVPLRVFVESCVATSGQANITYQFIENSGCMVDAKLTGSGSRFMSRIQDDKLYFQLEAFRFQNDPSGLMYITCHLKATTASSPIDMMNKACSFSGETMSWFASSGDDQVCGCCESTCTMRKGRSLDIKDSVFEEKATIGPIFISEMEDMPMRQSIVATEMASEDTASSPESSIGLVLISGLVVAVGILCIIILGALFYRRRQKRHTLACE